MVKLTLLYYQPKDPESFERYYAEIHLPLVSKVSGIRRLELAKVTGTPDGSSPAFFRIGELYFDSTEQMQEVISTPEMQAAIADISNFASGGVVRFISQIH
jgi:uncharacterized protein (TIGR02118 family)